MSTIFDVLDEPMPKSIPNEPDLTWRPWHGQVKPVVGWDAYAVEAENIARNSSAPNMVRAVHGLPLSDGDRGLEIPCPCDRCQRMRLEIVAVCHAHHARKQQELHHSDTLPRQRPSISDALLGLLQGSAVLLFAAWCAYELALRLADWALLHYLPNH